MEGTAQAHGATLLHLLLLHLMQPGAGAAGPGVGQDEAGQVAEAFLSPWGCLLVPKSSAVPRGLGRDLSQWLERKKRKVRRATQASALAGSGGSGRGSRGQGRLSYKDPKT